MPAVIALHGSHSHQLISESVSKYKDVLSVTIAGCAIYNNIIALKLQ